MQHEHKSNGHYYRFDSLTELMNYTDAGKFSNSEGTDWVGAYLPTWSAAVDKVVQPWPEGAAIVESFVERLEDSALPEVRDRKRRVRFNDHDGDDIDLDRLRSGQDYWRKSERQETHGPQTLTVITDLTARAYVDAKDVLWRGAAAIAITKILEAKGYQVELWAIKGWHRTNNTQGLDKVNRVVTGVQLKRPCDPLDVGTISGALSAWFYRTINFTMTKTQCSKEVAQQYPYSGGYSFTALPTDLDHYTTDENRVYSAGVFSFQGALDLIKEEIRRVSEFTKVSTSN